MKADEADDLMQGGEGGGADFNTSTNKSDGSADVQVQRGS